MTDLTIVGPQNNFLRVQLQEPASSGYLFLGAEVDRRPAFFPNSRRKRNLIERAKAHCNELAADPRVVSAVVFDAILIPPGRGQFLKKRPSKTREARFDLAILVETGNVADTRTVEKLPAFRAMAQGVEATANTSLRIRATNVRRIAPVDHSRDGAFLFNYFFADETSQNIAVWEYTAGWFQQETGLDNSTVLLPEPGQAGEYSIINHCRWDRVRDFLPSLLFKPSFRRYVLANFFANHVAAEPIIYRIA